MSRNHRSWSRPSRGHAQEDYADRALRGLRSPPRGPVTSLNGLKKVQASGQTEIAYIETGREAAHDISRPFRLAVLLPPKWR